MNEFEPEHPEKTWEDFAAHVGGWDSETSAVTAEAATSP